MDFFDNSRKILSSPKYAEAMKKSADFKKRISEANAFRLDSIAGEAGAYFSTLKANDPEIFNVIKIQRKEISELLVRKRTGIKVVLD